jgi:hypothetical protein
MTHHRRSGGEGKKRGGARSPPAPLLSLLSIISLPLCLNVRRPFLPLVSQHARLLFAFRPWRRQHPGMLARSGFFCILTSDEPDDVHTLLRRNSSDRALGLLSMHARTHG